MRNPTLSRNVTNTFPTLSLKDLLDAREAYHIHLSHLPNVVATAVGLFRVRREEAATSHSDPARWRTLPDATSKSLADSVVTPQSWPSVLVLVDKWQTPQELAAQPDAAVPRRLYLPDGRVVPTCVLLVESDPSPAPPIDQLSFPASLMGGGYPVVTDVQGVQHVGSVGCLVSDGEQTYALTNRHVAGAPGREAFTILRGQPVRIGVSHEKQIGKRPFADMYQGWPGQRVFVNVDVGLIRIDDVTLWTSQVYGIGVTGPLVDLHVNSMSLDLIGLKVRAFGAASRELEGEVFALFYRYRSIAGVDYVADVLIGPTAEGRPVRTRPGDSGTIWYCVAEPTQASGDDGGLEMRPFFNEVQKLRQVSRMRQTALREADTAALSGPSEAAPPARLRTGFKTAAATPVVQEEPVLSPLAIQWGGHRLRDVAEGAPFQFALGTFLSTVCRELDVELLTDHNTGFSEYWGQLGHFKVAAKACELAPDLKLRAFLMANQDRIAPLDAVLTKKLPSFEAKAFIPLSDVPDLRWRSSRGKDKANHFADMDQAAGGDFKGGTLLELTRDPAKVDARVFAGFYDALGIKAPKDRGALPFRVWQLYEVMVEALRHGHLDEFLCAGGVMTHYAGDACQSLHISKDHHGANEDESGVHAAYETQMLDANRVDVVASLNTALADVAKVSKQVARMAAFGDGHGAAVAVVKLMRATYKELPPRRVIEVYLDVDRPRDMWPPLRSQTVANMARGCKTLAAIWQSAWREGNGAKIATSKLKAIPFERLMALYEDRSFAESMWLDEMIEAGIGVL